MLLFSKKLPTPQYVKERYRTPLYASNYVKFKDNTGLNYDYLFYYMDMLVDRLEDRGALLDAGCGSGALLKKIHQKKPHISLFGLDISELMLTHLNSPSRPIQGDLFSLPFKDASFHQIVCTTVSEMFSNENFEAILRELKRVTSPGGRIFTLYKNPYSLWEIYWWFYKYEYYQNSYTLGQLKRLAQKVGLPIKALWGTYLAAPPIIYRNHLAWYRDKVPEPLLKLIFKMDVGYLARLFPFFCRHFLVEHMRP